MRIRISEIMEISKTRPEGFTDDWLAHGKRDGDFLTIENNDYASLLKKYRGLGDIVAVAAKPVAKAIDAILGTDFKNCPGCAKRQDKLNKAFPLT